MDVEVGCNYGHEKKRKEAELEETQRTKHGQCNGDYRARAGDLYFFHLKHISLFILPFI